MPTIVFQGDTRGVRRATQDVSSQVKTMGAGIQNALGAVGVGLSVAGAIAGLRSIISEMDGIKEAAARVGVSSQEMQVLAYAAKMSGVEVGEVEMAYRKLSDTIGSAMSGNKAAVDALARLGLAAGDFAGKDMAERFRMVATAILSVSDESERAALAADVLGKSGARMLPTLRELGQLREEAMGKGLLIGDKELEAADRFNDQLTTMETRIKALVGNSGLVPWLADVAEGLDKVAQGAGIEESKPEVTNKAARAGLWMGLVGAWVTKLGAGAVGATSLEKRADKDMYEINARLHGGRTIKTGAPNAKKARQERIADEERANTAEKNRASQLNNGNLTKLSEENEAAFREWFAAMAKENKINPNPNDPRHFYDYRGLWEQTRPLVGEHGTLTEHGDYRFPDEFKMPGHPVPPEDGGFNERYVDKNAAKEEAKKAEKAAKEAELDFYARADDFAKRDAAAAKDKAAVILALKTSLAAGIAGRELAAEAKPRETRWSTSVFGGALSRVGGDTSRVMDIAQASLDVQRNKLLERIATNTETGAVFP